MERASWIRILLAGAVVAAAAEAAGGDGKEGEEYQKFAQGAGSGEGSDYRKYLHKFGGDYQKYMGGDAPGGAGIDYKHRYEGRYAGDYQKFAQESGQSSNGFGGYIDRFADGYKKYAKPEGSSPGTELKDQYMGKYAGQYVGPEGTGPATDYKGQYMGKYAGQYKDFMGAGGSVSTGGEESTNDDTKITPREMPTYSEYMKAHRDDYSRFVHQKGDAQPVEAVSTEASAPSSHHEHQQAKQKGDYQGSNFEKYMKSYAPGAQEYTAQGKEYGAGYNNYMDQSRQGADYQKYIDQYGSYQKYAKEGAGAQEYTAQGKEYGAGYNNDMDQSRQGADYQKYIDQYGSYQKYAKEGAGYQNYKGYYKQDSDYQGYTGDYQKYAKAAPAELIASGGEEAQKTGSSKSSSSGDTTESGQAEGGWEQRYGKYEQEYAGEYIPEMENASNPREWEHAFVKKYAEPYRRYIEAHDRMAKEFPNAPASASACRSLGQLKEWRGAQREMIHSYVPSHYRSFSYGAIEQEYRQNRARIEKEEEAAKEKAKQEQQKAAEAKKPEGGESGAKPEAPTVAPELLAAADGGSGGAAAAAAGRPGEARKWTREYARDYAPMPDEPSDWADWQRRFLRRFAGPYQKYVEDSHRLAHQYHTTPIRAEDARTMADLRRWRDAQNAQIDTFIPQSYRHFVAGAVEQKYAENKARIERDLAKQEGAKKEEEAKKEEPAKEEKAKKEDMKAKDGAKSEQAKQEETKKEEAKNEPAKKEEAVKEAAKDENADAKPKAASEAAAAPVAFLSSSAGSEQSAPPAVAPGLVLATTALVALSAFISFSFAGVVRRYVLFRSERTLGEQLLRPEAPFAD